LTNSTSSLSGGLPTIAERQKLQKNRRELVTLELTRKPLELLSTRDN
jgi:hypothetical protein